MNMSMQWNDDAVLTRNSEGKWVPGIPLPFYVFPGYLIVLRCGTCRAWFWTMKGYRGHYALLHILKLERG
jgi:hypothetical protein